MPPKLQDPRRERKVQKREVEIDWVEFDKLCALRCTIHEFASFFDCSLEIIEQRVYEAHGIKFVEYFRQKEGKGKVAIRRAQVQRALAGSDTMLIWLGKNWLGQVDRSQIEHSGPDKGPITVQYEKLSMVDLATLDSILAKAEGFDGPGLAKNAPSVERVSGGEPEPKT